MKKPQHMFDHPSCDGVLGDQCEGDFFPYGGEMMAEMMATGPSCVKKGKECGILHPPCCEIDPDTNVRVNLMCEYRPEADVTKKYESGKCAENPNPPIRKAVPLRLDELKGRN